jgi:mannose-1-phosphate guanylyltransferase
VLTGITPTYPSTEFGYIKRNGLNVEEFKEKPDLSNAQKYLADGDYFWNAGYFLGQISAFRKEIDQNSPNMKSSWQTLSEVEELFSDDYQNAYLSLESEAIDYSLMEKATELKVISATFDWADVGSFKDLAKVAQINSQNTDKQGNLHESHNNLFQIEATNNFVINQIDKPIALIGLDDVVVINTPNGLLISTKDKSHLVGSVAKKLAQNSN